LGISEIINNQLFETVHPCVVSKNFYIDNVGGVMNAVILEGKPVGESILQGEGAGVLLIQCSMPIDVLNNLVLQFIQQKKVVDSIASTIVVSTVISFFTIPVVVFFTLKYFNNVIPIS